MVKVISVCTRCGRPYKGPDYKTARCGCGGKLMHFPIKEEKEKEKDSGRRSILSKD